MDCEETKGIIGIIGVVVIIIILIWSGGLGTLFDITKSLNSEIKEIEGNITDFDQYNSTLILDNTTYQCNYWMSGGKALLITADEMDWKVKITYTDFREGEIMIKNIEVLDE